MKVDLLTHLAELGFGVVTPFTYQVRGGGVPIGTTSTIEIVIDGGNDFCVTDIFVFMKNAGGGEGGDFRMRDSTNNIDFQNLTMPVDTGSADRPKIPIQTIPGQPSVLQLPWVLQAATVMQFTAFARFGTIQNFDVILNGYKLDTLRANVPYQPYVYLFNGPVDDIAGETFGVFQESIIQGSSDFLCFSITSNWDTSAVNVDIRETLRNGSIGQAISKRVLRFGRSLPRPYDDSFEVYFPLPWHIPNNSALSRELSNHGLVPERRPEMFVFGYFDTRSETQKGVS